jgi:hypothetical protein
MTRPDEGPPVSVSRRRVLQLVGGTLAVAITSHTFGDAKATTGPDGDDDTQFDERRYRGTAATKIAGDRFSGGKTQQSLRRDVVITVTPTREGYEGHANPFELTVDGPAEGTSAVGPGRIVTADVAFDAEGRERTVKHWDVQAGDDGVVSGVLRSSDAESNVLTSKRALIPGHEETMLLVTEAMAGGTTLAGTITPERLELDVSGNTVNRFAGDLLDQSRPFVTQIRATRER